MKELGKKSLSKDLNKTLLSITLILLVYQGIKLAGSILYLCKLSIFKYTVAKHNEERMDNLANHKEFLQRPELDGRQPEGEQVEASEGSQDDLEENRQQQHFKLAKELQH